MKGDVPEVTYIGLKIHKCMQEDEASYYFR